MSGDVLPLPFYAFAECTRTTAPLTIHSKVAYRMYWTLHGGLAVCYWGTDSGGSEELSYLAAKRSRYCMGFVQYKTGSHSRWDHPAHWFRATALPNHDAADIEYEQAKDTREVETPINVKHSQQWADGCHKIVMLLITTNNQSNNQQSIIFTITIKKTVSL
jgi:hypothetical protein